MSLCKNWKNFLIKCCCSEFYFEKYFLERILGDYVKPIAPLNIKIHLMPLDTNRFKSSKAQCGKTRNLRSLEKFFVKTAQRAQKCNILNIEILSSLISRNFEKNGEKFERNYISEISTL